MAAMEWVRYFLLTPLSEWNKELPNSNNNVEYGDTKPTQGKKIKELLDAQTKNKAS